MRLEIPRNIITNQALQELKEQLKALIKIYEKKYQKTYKIYLYVDYLKINFLKHNYFVTIVELNNNLFWYLYPFMNSYLLINVNDKFDIDKILKLINKINS